MFILRSSTPKCLDKDGFVVLCQYMNTARIVEEHKTQYIIRTTEGKEYAAVIRGKFLIHGVTQDFPKVGDYVQFTELTEGQAVIESIFPRTTQIIRKASGTNEPQVIVANVSIIFIVMGLDMDFNLRRLERYLLLAEQSAITPVIILNKSDTVTTVDDYIIQVKEIAPTIAMHAVSAETGFGMKELLNHFTKETTGVLLGSSGAGKSTITNWIMGNTAQSTQPVREDDGRGRHTTTYRALFELPGGGYLIDTPGMRELAIFTTGATDTNVFADVELLLTQCKYLDCDHEKSRGCAVQNAIYDGILDEKHFRSYQKLKKEQEYLQTKLATGTVLERKQKTKNIQKEFKKIKKFKQSDF